MDEIVLLLQELNENGRHNIIFTLYLSLTFNIKCCSYEILYSIAISVQRLVDCQLLLADERGRPIVSSFGSFGSWYNQGNTPYHHLQYHHHHLQYHHHHHKYHHHHHHKYSSSCHHSCHHHYSSTKIEEGDEEEEEDLILNILLFFFLSFFSSLSLLSPPYNLI